MVRMQKVSTKIVGYRNGFSDREGCIPIGLEYLTRSDYAELIGTDQISIKAWDIQYANSYYNEFMQLYATEKFEAQYDLGVKFNYRHFVGSVRYE